MTVGGGAGFLGAPPDILLSVDTFEVGGGWCVCVRRGGEECVDVTALATKELHIRCQVTFAQYPN